MAAIGSGALAQLLRQLGAPATPGNMKFLAAWQRAEGGNASFNPFNTTQPSAGASNYNSVGVKNYPSLTTGLQATARTLLNGKYGPIVAGLRSGKATPAQLATAVAMSPWGTGSGVLRVLNAKPERPPLGTLEMPPLSDGTGGMGPIRSTSLAGPNPREAIVATLLQASSQAAAGQTPDFGSILQLAQARQQQQAAQEQYGATPQATGPLAGHTSAGVSGITQTASKYLGVPYKWGGNNPKTGIDCSAFIQQVYAQHGVKIPRTTYDQFKTGQAVGLTQLQPGDAVFTRPGKAGPNHVGLYIGNGQIQESPHTGDVNKIVPLKSFVTDGYVGARRYAA
jgi:cell wall-associated NlpC family hydrolase